jgi:hypothetical protein
MEPSRKHIYLSRSKSSHRCSIGIKYGDSDDQGALLRSGWLERQQ